MWLTPELVELHLFRNIVLIQNRHQPASYRGPVVLFKAEDATTHYLHGGDRLGWEAHIDGLIKITSIPGTHSSMMGLPGLSDLSVALTKELDELDALAAGQRSPADQAVATRSGQRRDVAGTDGPDRFQEFEKTGAG